VDQQLALVPPLGPHQAAAPEARTPPYAIAIYKVALVRESQMTPLSSSLRSSAEAAALVHRYLGAVDREHCVVVLLDQKHKAIGLHTVSIGTLTASLVHPREVFKPAILANAAALLVAHNHPSGEPTPSAEDKALTTRLVEAGKVLGIPVLDHIIVGDGTATHFSFADHGLL